MKNFKQNILCDEVGQSELVDLQYYNYGASLWGLAFYFSKEKESFTDTCSGLVKQIPLDQIGFFYFYILLPHMLHVDKSNIENVLKKLGLC